MMHTLIYTTLTLLLVANFAPLGVAGEPLNAIELGVFQRIAELNPDCDICKTLRDSGECPNGEALLCANGFVTSLVLSSAKLVALPSQIGLLTNMTLLFVGNNQLGGCPSQIGQLTGLTEL